LCYVKLDLTPYSASRYCEKNGMTLSNIQEYGLESKIISQVKLWFGWPKASFTIKGRTGQRCSIITGDGKIGTAPCKFANHFLCQHVFLD
jgi:hypothetical protein